MQKRKVTFLYSYTEMIQITNYDMQVQNVIKEQKECDITHSVQLLIFCTCLFLVLRSLSLHSTNHYSTHLPLPVLFLPVSVWLMAVLILKKFSALW